jgi:hypothetical protein
MQPGEQKVPGAVPGKDTPGTVRAVGGGSEAHHHDAGIRVAEARYGTTPVGFVRVRGSFLNRHRLAPGNEPWTSAAADYLVFQGG